MKPNSPWAEQDTDIGFVHLRMLQTVYSQLTGDKLHGAARMGDHWEKIGFQGGDPSTDLRDLGMFSVLQMVYLVCKHRESADEPALLPVYSCRRSSAHECLHGRASTHQPEGPGCAQCDASNVIGARTEWLLVVFLCVNVCARANVFAYCIAGVGAGMCGCGCWYLWLWVWIMWVWGVGMCGCWWTLQRMSFVCALAQRQPNFLHTSFYACASSCRAVFSEVCVSTRVSCCCCSNADRTDLHIFRECAP